MNKPNNEKIILDSNQREKLIQQALSYAEQDIPVVGCSIYYKNGKLVKHPPFKGGFCKENLTTDSEKIKNMFSKENIVAIGTMPEECEFNIIDIDPKSDKAGRGKDELLEALKEIVSVPDTLTVQTISNGRHIYYTTDTSIIGGVRFFDPTLPVDLLPHNKNSAGIILPDGINYHILDCPDDAYNDFKKYIKPLPVEIIKKGKLKDEPQDQGEPQKERVEQRRRAYTIKECVKYLSIIAKSKNQYADNYNTCIQVVGFGLHNNFAGSDVGLELFHDFCSKSDKYSPEWCIDKWQTFGADSGKRKITFTSVIALAVEAQENILRERFQTFFYISKSNTYWNSTSEGSIFDNMQTPQNMRVMHGGDFSKAIDNEVFSNNFISQLVYEPGGDRFIKEKGQLFLNTYEPPQIVPENKKPEMFLKHMEYMFPEEDQRLHILRYIAHMIQKPKAKIKHALCIIGNPGIGKSYFSEMLKAILGESNVTEPTNEAVAERWTGWAEHAQVCVLNEIYQSDKKHFADKMKPFITDSTLEIRKMQQNPYSIKNYMNIISFTNSEAPLFLEEHDRRWFIVKCPGTPMEGEYYKKLFNEVKEHPGRILKYLQSVNLEEFNLNLAAPKTEAKAEVTKQSKGAFEYWLTEQIEDNMSPLNTEFSMETLFTSCPDDIKFNRKAAAAILKKSGFKNKFINTRDKRGRFWYNAKNNFRTAAGY